MNGASGGKKGEARRKTIEINDEEEEEEEAEDEEEGPPEREEEGARRTKGKGKEAKGLSTRKL